MADGNTSTVVWWVAAGGAVGAAARYTLAGIVHRFTSASFPYGTFAVNMIGCLLFGLIFGLTEQRFQIPPAVRAFLLVGVLGGFTTFSSYAFESFQLLRDAEYFRASANVAGQVVLGLVCFWLGYLANRVL
ncbi:MAG: fluoride efflux transporter CrcB [Rhodospirillaceae bacterium]